VADLIPVLEQAVALTGHLAWPVVALIVLYMIRSELRQIVLKLAERIGDPRSDLSIGKTGLEIRQRVSQSDASSDILAAEIDQNAVFEGRLQRWIRDKGLTISVTSFIYGGAYKSLREAAVHELLPPAREGEN
jgi:hypothetical protein